MRSIVWMSVFALLILELVITLLLVLPLPRRIRRFLAKKILCYDLGHQLRFFAKFIFFALVLAIADAINSQRNITQREESTESSGYPEGQNAYIRASLDRQRKFRAERNMYLAGFALTLGFVILRLIELIQEIVSGEEEKESLQKQITDYENAAKGNHSTQQTTEESEQPDQEGTPLETIKNSLHAAGLRRRSGATADDESIASEITNGKED